MVDVGDDAPDFELADQDRRPVRLSSFRGEKNVVLVFYPLAFTGTCQGELCAIRDSIEDFSGDDVVTLAVSVDSPAVHKKWADEQGYTFPLLADFWPHGEVARRYGAFREDAGVASRTTVFLDAAGIVRSVFSSPPGEARPLSAYRAALAALPEPPR